MAVFRTIHIQNNNKVEKWFDTKEEAEQYLTRKAAIDLVNKVIGKGLSLEKRADILIEGLPAYYESLDKFEIQEFVPHK